MNYIALITLAILVTGSAGGIAAWYSRSEGRNTIDLLKTQVAAYKDNEELHLAQITDLQAQVAAKEEAIKRLQTTIKDMVKAFKDYKDGNPN